MQPKITLSRETQNDLWHSKSREKVISAFILTANFRPVLYGSKE